MRTQQEGYADQNAVRGAGRNLVEVRNACVVVLEASTMDVLRVLPFSPVQGGNKHPDRPLLNREVASTKICIHHHGATAVMQVFDLGLELPLRLGRCDVRNIRHLFGVVGAGDKSLQRYWKAFEVEFFNLLMFPRGHEFLPFFLFLFAHLIYDLFFGVDVHELCKPFIRHTRALRHQLIPRPSLRHAVVNNCLTRRHHNLHRLDQFEGVGVRDRFVEQVVEDFKLHLASSFGEQLLKPRPLDIIPTKVGILVDETLFSFLLRFGFALALGVDQQLPIQVHERNPFNFFENGRWESRNAEARITGGEMLLAAQAHDDGFLIISIVYALGLERPDLEPIPLLQIFAQQRKNLVMLVGRGGHLHLLRLECHVHLHRCADVLRCPAQNRRPLILVVGGKYAVVDKRLVDTASGLPAVENPGGAPLPWKK